MTRLRINGIEEEVAVTTVSELLAARGGRPRRQVPRRRPERRRCTPCGVALDTARAGRRCRDRETFFRRLTTLSGQYPMTDPFLVAGTPLSSRLFIGTAGYPNQQVLLDCLEASGAEIVTVSIRRISLEGYAESLVDVLGGRCRLLPNTAGCVTVRDAVLTAELAREALDTQWVKLELIGDRETLYPRCRTAGPCGRRVGAQRLQPCFPIATRTR